MSEWGHSETTSSFQVTQWQNSYLITIFYYKGGHCVIACIFVWLYVLCDLYQSTRWIFKEPTSILLLYHWHRYDIRKPNQLCFCKCNDKGSAVFSSKQERWFSACREHTMQPMHLCSARASCEPRVQMSASVLKEQPWCNTFQDHNLNWKYEKICQRGRLFTFLSWLVD